jgi:gamma-glutamyltranspeptidase / glutathione hydrolase
MSQSLLYCFLLLAAVAGACCMIGDEVGAAVPQRTLPPAYGSGRSPAVGTHGMVASSHPLATQIGLDVLKAGGNAVDAAIAVNAALGLMEPMSCGIGGDLYALVWDAKTGTLHGLNASGRAPARATRKWFADKGYKEIPGRGPLSWSVPGCVDGWAELHKRFGKAPWPSLLEPSIHYAEEGFPMVELLGYFWNRVERQLKSSPDTAKTYLPDGHAPAVGALFKNPYLAHSYRLIAEGGRDAFYKGPIAKEIVAFSDQHGGLFSLSDFADNKPTWVEPVKTNYRGVDVWEIPPPGQGIATLQMLNLLKAYDLKKLGPQSTEFWHLFVEAKKLAYADRARYYADPAFVSVPTAELISDAYADARRRLIKPDQALKDVEPGDPKLGKSDTVYLCVVDKDQNCVSLIESNFAAFGSGLVPGDLGFVLQNRGELFALDEKHPNRLEPGKRPFHTIIPALATKNGKPWFVFGVMGGDMQPQGQVEVLVNLLDFGMNVQQAGEAPRIEHVGSATPTGRPGKPDGGTVRAEPGIPDSVVDGLRKLGHNVEREPYNGGGYQGILIDPQTGVLQGGSEVRKDGCAAGY